MSFTLFAATFAHAEPLAAFDLALDVADDGPVFDDPLAGIRLDGQAPNVVGGKPVRDGRWDDAVGIVFFSAYVGCTGTLIGPRVVLTAGHCVIGYPVTHVIVGSKDWTSGEGEAYEVEDIVEYPNSQRTRDIALVFLAEPVKGVEPRPIGMECVTEEHLRKNSPVQIVGYGVTSESGNGNNTLLNEARSKVLDPTCKNDVINGVFAGCSAAAKPAGEIAAGGDGVDACFGDSGGPLYLLTDDGDFVIGATSRAFLGADFDYPCRDGGIWVRPDAVIDWILDESGAREVALPTCNDVPEVARNQVTVEGNEPGTLDLDIDDPDGEDDLVVIEVLEAPEHGTVTIDGEVVTYVANDDVVGTDSFTLTLTDGGTDWPLTGAPVSVEVPVDVTITEAKGCGCDTGSPAGLLGVGLVLVAARRRTARRA